MRSRCEVCGKPIMLNRDALRLFEDLPRCVQCSRPQPQNVAELEAENARLRSALNITRRPLEAYIGDLARDGYDETPAGHEAEMALTVASDALEKTDD